MRSTDTASEGMRRSPAAAPATAPPLVPYRLGRSGSQDAAEAEAMLERLSGRAHRVLTAVALRHEAGVEAAQSETEVRFRPTTAAERRAYCVTGESFDKAGGYGIQGRAAVFVESTRGSYSGVVGLPLSETAALLTRCGALFWLAARAA